MEFITGKYISSDARCYAAWERRLGCRYSMQWCRRINFGQPQRQARQLMALGWCVSSRYMVPRDATTGVPPKTCGLLTEEGKNFDLTPSSLSSLEPFRKHLTIVSDTDCRMADAFAPKEIGGDHFRTTAVFLTQAHPKQTEGSDVDVGTSFDQIYAQKFGHETPIPSMQLTIENVDQAGGCAYGYACAYTDTISWSSPNNPMPMVRDPRSVFEQMFGAGGTPEQRAQRMKANRSILDWVMEEMAGLRRSLGAV